MSFRNKMLSDLENNDPHDHEWKPKHKRKKSMAKNGQFVKIHRAMCNDVCGRNFELTSLLQVKDLGGFGGKKR